MARRASLEARVGLDSTPFQRGLARLRQQATSFARGFARSIAQAGKAVATVGVAGVAAAGAGLTFLIKKTADYGDAIDKMSKRTGLSVQFLQKLGHAAELGGTNLATMEKAVRRLQGASSDAAAGLKTYTREFDKLGIDVKDTNGDLKDTESLFIEVADALAKVENNTEKAAIAQKLLGRAGTQLLPQLTDGAEGFVAAMKEAEQLGAIMSPQDVKVAADFKDEIARTRNLLLGMGRRFAVNFLPAINAALVTFRKKIKELQEEGLFARIAVNVERGVALFAASVHAFIKSTDKLAFIGGIIVDSLQAGAKILVLEIRKALSQTKLGRSLVGEIGPGENAQKIKTEFFKNIQTELREMGDAVVKDGNFNDLIFHYQRMFQKAKADMTRAGSKVSSAIQSVGEQAEDIEQEAIKPDIDPDAASEFMDGPPEPPEQQFSQLRNIGANMIAKSLEELNNEKFEEKQLTQLQQMQQTMKKYLPEIARQRHRGGVFT